MFILRCQPHDAVYHALKARDVSFTIRQEFEAENIFVGMSLDFSDAEVSTFGHILGVSCLEPG